jgi:uncharacterized membrane protein YccF (DUF307 family)
MLAEIPKHDIPLIPSLMLLSDAGAALAIRPGDTGACDRAMSAALNFLWFILGGWLMGLAWWFAAILLALTIVGLPWAAAAWRIGSFSFFPFGRTIIEKSTLEGYSEPVTGLLRLILNVVWFVLAGWYLALGHLALAFCLGVTIIGIPFAIQHLKLAGLSLAPVGTEIVRVEVADAARRMQAEASVAKLRDTR